MKIVVALGSFKDVYTSIEVCSMIKNILADNEKLEIITAPVCDGGEYTYEILKYYFSCHEETVKHIYNPYGRYVTASYLVINNEAYIISSEILHLSSSEEQYRNPLILSDYGLGQLVADAIRKGYEKINICLGGTSTIGYGMGFAQALGARFWDIDNQEITQPIHCSDLINIKRAEFPSDQYSHIHVNVINDGITRCSHLDTVNPLKIGRVFDEIKESILEQVDSGRNAVLQLTGLMADIEYSGNGGAVYYGIESVFSATYCLGGEYFSRLFHLNEKITDCDLVITGEGRYDNPHLHKLPIYIAGMAKKQNKRVIYICGQTDESLHESITDGICSNNAILQDYGISTLITCQDDIRNQNISGEGQGLIKHYREVTPEIVKDKLKELLI